MAEFPALQLWTDAYLGDTTHLTTIEHGAYLLLLMTAWRTSDCSLPDDDRLLARYARLTPGQWARMKPTILAFWHVKNGRFFQRRLTDERDAVKRKSESGKTAAAAKWLKHKKARHANAYADDMRISANHNHNHNHNQLDANASNNNAHSVAPDGTSSDFDAFWKAYPRRVGKEAARKAFAACRKRGAEAWHIIEGAEWMASHPPEDPKFIPYPATWLNQGRYDDERTENARQLVEGTRSAPAGGYRRSIGLDMLRAAADEAGFDWSGTAKPDCGT